MKMTLYYDPENLLTDAPVNEGFDDALSLSQALLRKRAPVQLVNTSKLGEEELRKAYFDAVAASVQKKYRIRQIFGSRRRSGWLFGRGVPALLVYGQSRVLPDDVYPHENLGRIMTIKEFLNKAGSHWK